MYPDPLPQAPQWKKPVHLLKHVERSQQKNKLNPGVRPCEWDGEEKVRNALHLAQTALYFTKEVFKEARAIKCRL